MKAVFPESIHAGEVGDAAGAPSIRAFAQRGVWYWLVWALIAIAALRAVAFVTHDPLLAFANNFDMVRVQGCIEAYPLRASDVHPWTMSYDQPLERYAFRGDALHPCYLTSEALFAFAAYPFMKLEARVSEDGGFSLRTLGLIKVIVLLAIGCCITALLLRAQATAAATANGAVLALVMADPGVLLYASGFYMEASAAVALYAAIALAVVAAAQRRADRSVLAGFGVAVVLLVLSKVQHAFVGLAFATVLLPVFVLHRPLLGLFTVAFVTGALSLAVQLAHLGSDEVRAIQGSSRTNVALYTILPLAQDPARTAALLGLPRECVQHAGKSWFTPGVTDSHPCPAVWQMRRTSIVALAWRDPATFFGVVRGGLDRLRPWIPDYLGHVGGVPHGRLPQTVSTWNRLLDRVAQPVFNAFLIVPAFVVLLLFAFRRASPAVITGYALLAWLPWPIFAAALLGDGFIDVPKHSHLVFLCTIAFWLVFVGHAMTLFAARIAARRGNGTEAPT